MEVNEVKDSTNTVKQAPTQENSIVVGNNINLQHDLVNHYFNGGQNENVPPR